MKNEVKPEGAAAESWRAEYPIQRDGERRVTRRGFCVSLGAAGACVAGIEFWSGNETEADAAEMELAPNTAEGTSPIKLCALDDIPEGAALALKLESRAPLMLVRLPATPTGPSRVVAYDPRCTHLMCPTHYDAASNKIVCPCHHGFFSPEDGRALAGPPKKPLRRYKIEIRNGAVYLLGRA